MSKRFPITVYVLDGSAVLVGADETNPPPKLWPVLGTYSTYRELGAALLRWAEPESEQPTEYLFDCNILASIRVMAKSEGAARQMLNEALDCADANFGAWPDGSPILGEASLAAEGEPWLVVE